MRGRGAREARESSRATREDVVTERIDLTQRANAGYVEELYRLYLADPAAVTPEWALVFAGFDLAGHRPPAVAGTDAERGAYALVNAYREFGHLVARLDPLSEPPGDHPLLALAAVGLTTEDLGRPSDGAPFRGPFDGTYGGLLEALRTTYCGTLGVEFMQVPDDTVREWLAERMEAAHNRPALEPHERVQVLSRLLAADGFEQFLHVKYVGQKRFSLEGAAALIPMLDTLLERASDRGVEQIVMGMPHRGRLNVLALVMGKPYERIFSEFEASFAPQDVTGHGDVKYHMGYSSVREMRGGRSIHVDMNFNPSHLEFVNPVVLGSMRARQDLMHDAGRDRGIPVLLHGDAAFAGEGVVSETLVMAPLPSYETGGTVHVVVNNQIGFTTSPWHQRSSRYCTDLARVIGAPVLHVNGDDPEAAVHAIAIAVDYRMRFKRDLIIDLICYRRHGHNELDDPTFTQPAMYRTIARHVPASRRYAERLVAEGVLDLAAVQTIERDLDAGLQAAHQRARSADPYQAPTTPAGAWSGLEWAGDDWSADTAVARERLRAVVDGLTRFPDGFAPHPKIARLATDRREMFEADRIDWGLGEALALGSLLVDGRNVRMSGQDTGRGTFSHRHAVPRDQNDGHRFVPLQHLAESQGRIDLIDTPLNEAACLGFEYGYSTADPHTLVVWEAQFGDFANVAQVYIDQFIASAESKWRRMSGLVLLLPHGYEGQGPEHSSARLERFLELCANGNMQVCNLTTPAQLFHALRRQLQRRFRKPLVIMSPKSLLRHKRVVSPVAAFADGGFQNVLDDPDGGDAKAVRRVLLTSGKFFYTLQAARETRALSDVALVRLEQLYPFPSEELGQVFARYPNARDLRWVQEEPANMGAWRAIRHRLEDVLPTGATLSLAARKAAPTPATGYYAMHVEQERELLDRALCEVGALRPRATSTARDGTARARRARRENG
ncbi:MAG: 2-oxoglutarate dehydrogenase E1 component [Candidatus Eisenbacteria bacterium]|uniref:oxoglutarate dehydrogenase (succinyl-transferring) n=1 Tax=Eiseniibacteriota bacterium TaxID=2212470 RepID=A0A849SIK5_UNCEI|nr:2-oxoglutarate dehydrogenase E1 component [Candidatus Eisenbacteria bacterium]